MNSDDYIKIFKFLFGIPASKLDNEIIRRLVEQVRLAVPKGGSEKDVITVITRPMWRRFLRYIGINSDIDPVFSKSAKNNLTVYGSETIVVERPYEASFSYAREKHFHFES